MTPLTYGADLYQAAADLSATAGDIAANLGEGRACPGLLAHARDMLDTLAADLGDTPEDRTQLALFDADPYRAATITPAPAGSRPATEEAIGVLFAERHRLGPDALRSLQGIWDCASAARYGEPYEAWDFDPEFYADHDTAECEQDNA